MTGCIVNGEQGDRIRINDRGLAYGDGCFETIAVKHGEPLLWQPHMQRLFASCGRLGIRTEFDSAVLEHEARQVLKQHENAVLKIMVTRGTGGQGYRADKGPATRIVCSLPWRARAAGLRDKGIRLRICETRLACNPRLAGIKHLNRLEQVLARAEWHDDYDEGLMLNAKGLVIEGTMSNIFLQAGDEVVTPALEECGVAGVIRDQILQILADTGITCRQEAITLDMIYKADALFVTNSLIGLWPVATLDNRTYPVTDLEKQLQHVIESVIVTE